jgi:hypothetical protein
MGKYCGHIPLSYLCCAFQGYDYSSYTLSGTLNLPCGSGGSIAIVFVILFLICAATIIVALIVNI